MLAFPLGCSSKLKFSGPFLPFTGIGTISSLKAPLSCAFCHLKIFKTNKENLKEDTKKSNHFVPVL
jgi:hypothetical protein